MLCRLRASCHMSGLQSPQHKWEMYAQVDEEFGRGKDASQVGTTAVVALVGDRQLYIGNCGGALLLPPPWLSGILCLPDSCPLPRLSSAKTSTS